MLSSWTPRIKRYYDLNTELLAGCTFVQLPDDSEMSPIMLKIRIDWNCFVQSVTELLKFCWGWIEFCSLTIFCVGRVTWAFDSSALSLAPQTSVSQSSLFEHLINVWEFKPGPTPHSTNLHFLVDFQFRSPLYRKVWEWLIVYSTIFSYFVSAYAARR